MEGKLPGCMPLSAQTRMYRQFFGFHHRPFSITPDPRFLYMSARHREALAHLLYGVGESGGFVQLTGEVGTGKTTVCRCLLEKAPDDVAVALILNPKLDALELLASVCDELRVGYPRDASAKELVDRLNAHLLDAHGRGRRTVLVIDEAQNLSVEVLEQVRLLTNLETAQDKLLQVILIGQPELKRVLQRSDLRQLAQRITARYHLEPLSLSQTRDYIRHRLRVAGAGGHLFTDGALREVHVRARGIPRLINVICDRALLGAYAQDRERVNRRTVRLAAREVLGRPPRHAPTPGWAAWLAGSLALVLAAVAWSVFAPYSKDPGRYALTAPAARGAARDKAITAAKAAEPIHPMQTPKAARRPTEDTAAGSALLGPDQAITTAKAAEPIHRLQSARAKGRQPSEEPAAPRVLLGPLLANAGTGVRQQAWQAMFGLWGLRLPPGQQATPCRAASAHGLRCLTEAGSWKTLRNIDRPVILELVTRDGRRVPVLLRHLRGDIARVSIGSHAYTLPVGALQNRWYGDYTVLWRPPAAFTVLQAGDRGPGVRWLRIQLQRALGPVPQARDPSRFDHALRARVERFQRKHDLRPDGVVGAQTLIQLNSRTTRPDTPHLCARTSKPA